MFTKTDDHLNFDVFVYHDDPVPGALGTTHHCIEDGELKGYVTVAAEYDPWTTKYVIAHELGHVIGLAHDSYYRSIMNPRTEYHLMGDWTLENIPVVTGEDEDAIEERYF